MNQKTSTNAIKRTILIQSSTNLVTLSCWSQLSFLKSQLLVLRVSRYVYFQKGRKWLFLEKNDFFKGHQLTTLISFLNSEFSHESKWKLETNLKNFEEFCENKALKTWTDQVRERTFLQYCSTKHGSTYALERMQGYFSLFPTPPVLLHLTQSEKCAPFITIE